MSPQRKGLYLGFIAALLYITVEFNFIDYASGEAMGVLFVAILSLILLPVAGYFIGQYFGGASSGRGGGTKK